MAVNKCTSSAPVFQVAAFQHGSDENIKIPDENTQDGEEEEVVTTRVKECDKMSCCAGARRQWTHFDVVVPCVVVVEYARA
jgi:hypothetical protein